MRMRSADRMLGGLIWLVLLAAIAARLLLLDADPPAGGWYGFITDEARWVETARNLYLNGTSGLYSFSELHLVLSPLFQAIAWLQFELFGLGFWQARLLSALAGCGLVLLICDLVRPFVSHWILLALAILVGFGPEFLLPSRIVSPDIVSLFFCVASLRMFSAPKPSKIRLCGGIFLLAAAVLVKATTLLFAPFLVLGLLWSWLSRDTAATFRVRRMAIGSGVTALALILFAAIKGTGGLTPIFQTLAGFLSFGGLYRAAAIFLDRSLGDTTVEVLPISFFVSLLGAWFAIWSAERDHGAKFDARWHLRLTVGIWSVGTLLVLALLAYPPVRYFIFVIAPLLILTALAIDDGCLDRASRAGAKSPSLSIIRRELFLISFLLPLAVFLAPAAVLALGQLGVGFASMSRRLGLIAVLVLSLSIACRAFITSATVCRRIVIVSVTGLLACAAIAVVRPEFRYWSAAAGDVALWACSSGIALGAVFWDAYRQLPARMTRTTRIPGAWVALIAAVLVGDLRPLLQPQYTLKDIAADIARRVPPDSKLLVSAAASLLLPTKLRYREETENLDSIDFVLAMSCFPGTCMVQPPMIIKEHFNPVATYVFTGRYMGKPTGTKLLLLQRKVAPRPVVDDRSK